MDNTNAQSSKLSTDPKELRRQLDKDLSEELQKNFDVFERKLKAQSDQVEATLRDTVRDESDRIIGVINSGSHEGIEDKVSSLFHSEESTCHIYGQTQSDGSIGSEESLGARCKISSSLGC